MSLGKYERFISPHHRHIHNAAAAAGEEEGSGKKGEFDLPCMRPLFGRFGSLSSRLPACPPVCVCEKSGQVWVCLCEKKGINHGSNGGWRIWVFFADAASWPQSEWETRARAQLKKWPFSCAWKTQPTAGRGDSPKRAIFEFRSFDGIRTRGKSYDGGGASWKKMLKTKILGRERESERKTRWLLKCK